MNEQVTGPTGVWTGPTGLWTEAASETSWQQGHGHPAPGGHLAVPGHDPASSGAALLSVTTDSLKASSLSHLSARRPRPALLRRSWPFQTPGRAACWAGAALCLQQGDREASSVGLKKGPLWLCCVSREGCKDPGGGGDGGRQRAAHWAALHKDEGFTGPPFLPPPPEQPAWGGGGQRQGVRREADGLGGGQRGGGSIWGRGGMQLPVS